MHIVAISSSRLPNSQAHPIQILKTWAAMARLPGVRVTLLCVALDSTPEELLKSMQLEPHPDLKIEALMPSWVMDRLGLDTYISTNRTWLYGLARWRLKRRLAKSIAQEPTVIHTRNESVVWWIWETCEALKIPLIVELHWLKYVDRFRRWRQRRDSKGETPSLTQCKAFLRKRRDSELDCLRHASMILPLTSCIKDRLEGWGLSNIEVVPSGTSVPPLPEEKPAETIDLLYAGQFLPWKGVDTVIRAMEHLPEYRLVLLGDHPPEDKRRLQNLAAEVGAADRCEFRGRVPHPEVAKAAAAAKVCVLPTPRKGFPEARFFTSPLKLYEFSAMGKAIVASDVPSLRDVLVHGENAWMVRPDDPVAFAHGIRNVMEDEELRARLGRNARAFAERHSYEERAKRLLRHMQKAAGVESAGG
ncbi:MAG: glycosyltransferase family 4 protein [Sumerlaeia bacterium]